MMFVIRYEVDVPPTSVQWQWWRLMRHTWKFIGFVFNLVSIFLHTLSIMMTGRVCARYVKGLIHLRKCSVQRLIFLVEESFYGGGYVAMLPTGQHRWVERDPPTHTSFQLVSTASTILASFIAGLNFVGPAVSFVSNFPCCVSIFSLQPSSIHFNKTILEFRKKKLNTPTIR